MCRPGCVNSRLSTESQTQNDGLVFQPGRGSWVCRRSQSVTSCRRVAAASSTRPCAFLRAARSSGCWAWALAGFAAFLSGAVFHSASREGSEGRFLWLVTTGGDGNAPMEGAHLTRGGRRHRSGCPKRGSASSPGHAHGLEGGRGAVKSLCRMGLWEARLLAFSDGSLLAGQSLQVARRLGAPRGQAPGQRVRTLPRAPSAELPVSSHQETMGNTIYFSGKNSKHVTCVG